MSAGGAGNLQKSPAARLDVFINGRIHTPSSAGVLLSRSRGSHTDSLSLSPSIFRKIHRDFLIIRLCPVPKGRRDPLLATFFRCGNGNVFPNYLTRFLSLHASSSRATAIRVNRESTIASISISRDCIPFSVIIQLCLCTRCSRFLRIQSDGL